jgi:predicted 3-demethylubiquinone-9 3-methyltransferase (glyoxalase superfamily)
MRKITAHLWYEKETIDAAELYVSVLPDSKIHHVSTLCDTPSGDTDIVSFELCGQPFCAAGAAREHPATNARCRPDPGLTVR